MKTARFLRAAVVLAAAVLGAGTMATASYATPGGSGGNHNGGGTVTACTPSNFNASGWRFDEGQAYITASVKAGVKCQGDVTLVTYLAPKPSFSVPQYLFGSETFHFDTQAADKKGTSHEFKAAIPNCNTQVDLFVGGEADRLLTIEKDGPLYGNKKIAYKNFGTSNCVQPAVQHSESCDGATTLNLSNNGQLSAYDVTFTVKYGNETKTVVVGKGKSEDLTVPANSGPITVSADKLPETTVQWSVPESCKPSAAATNDCKTTIVTVSNPEGNGDVPAKVTYNGETKTVTVPAGKSQDVSFDSAKAGTTATVSFPDSKFEDITVQVILGDCPNPEPSASASTSPSASASASPSASASESTSPAGSTPSASTSSTPGDVLALTGSNSSTIAGGAVLLVLVGAGLFFMARRRKLNFKA